MQEKRDEQLARELQEEENRIARSEGRKIPKAADLYGDLDSIIQKEDKKDSSKPAPLLFSENNGVLKNNTKKARPQPSKAAPIQIDANSLITSKEKINAAFKTSAPSSEGNKFDDNAWSTTDSTPALIPTPAKPVSVSPLPPPPPPPPPQVSSAPPLSSSSNILTPSNFNTPPPLPQPRQPSVSPLLSQQSMENANTVSKFNWGSNNPVSSPSTATVQSQMVLQSSLIHTQAPPPPPPLPQPVVAPLNSILQPPLIPTKSTQISQFNKSNSAPIPTISNVNPQSSNLLVNRPNSYLSNSPNNWSNTGTYY